MKPKYLLLPALFTGLIHGADLPPDKGNEVPSIAARPAVVTLGQGKFAQAMPKVDLPEGYSIELVAASPLVLHPIMGCVDPAGRLFLGDGVGVNWTKAQLDANPVNRVVMLEDTNKDGIFDKSTIFADRMTFPQGAAWLDGSLYVCSPPGLWKLTDTDNDGVADKREMLVSGFDYTGNAADIHGPFIHPNGRLYWCHGRKGHKATAKDGTVVHEGLACGIWSCKPDGTDLQWNSLGCGDNPVEVDFTPEGDIIGVQNLYYTNPRGDTLVHWLYGGVYERSDQFKAIEGLPRTLEHMPVMYNFGHVAVSGSCFWHQAPMGGLQFLVTHFNTQRLVRMELTPSGATFKATENEFIKLNNPDIHLTDVMEEKGGSLLLVDTGGWFRIGCPSSLMAKSDILGAVYRVKSAKPSKALAPATAWQPAWKLKDEAEAKAQMQSSEPRAVVAALDWIAAHGATDGKTQAVLSSMMQMECDASTEHALMNAARAVLSLAIPAGDLAASRALLVNAYRKGAQDTAGLSKVLADFDPARSKPLMDATRRVIELLPNGTALAAPTLAAWLKAADLSADKLAFVESVAASQLSKPEAQSLIAGLLNHESSAAKAAGVRVLAEQTGGVTNDAWLPAIEAMLAKSPQPALLDAIKHLKTKRFDATLQALANDAKQPQSLRLKALDSMNDRKVTGETFAMVLDVLTNTASSAAAKIQAATMMAHSGHTKDERMALAKAFATVGPIELKELLGLVRASKDEDVTQTMAKELAKNPALISQQESVYRTAFSSQKPEIFETLVLPSIHKAMDAIDAKKRQLGPLAEKVIASGDSKAGRAVYESGRGTCIACHQIADKGRSIGPNLSHIGAIRTERDILESVLFPSNTLARDYEAHIIETSGGETVTGVIKSHTAEGLLVVDVAGMEKSIPQASMVSDTQLTISLMPMGLDQTLPEKELLDLVAYLRSLK